MVRTNGRLISALVVASAAMLTAQSPAYGAGDAVLDVLVWGTHMSIDPAAYSQPANGTQGNMTRNSGPEGPGFWNIDGSLFKRFSVGGSRFAEFRVDAYNLTNSVRWGNPGTTFSTAAGNTFGQITGTTGGQRTIRFGGRFVF